MEFRTLVGDSTARLRRQLSFLVTLLVIMWLLELVDVVFLSQALNGLGVWPRQLLGLWGVLLMPFLHGGLAHLAANTLPFLVLGWLVMWRRTTDFVAVTAITTLLTGLTLWLFGSSHAVYIGASGIIFGYFGFLVFRGYFERSPQSLLVALLVIFLYGGLILGVVPQRSGVSWEAHLLGFISGALCARFLARSRAAEAPPPVIFRSDAEEL